MNPDFSLCILYTSSALVAEEKRRGAGGARETMVAAKNAREAGGGKVRGRGSLSLKEPYRL